MPSRPVCPIVPVGLATPGQGGSATMGVRWRPTIGPVRGLAHRMHLSPAAARPLIASMVVAMMLAVLAPFGPRAETGPIKVRASQTTLAVHGTRDFAIPSDTTHVAIHWRGEPTAHV